MGAPDFNSVAVAAFSSARLMPARGSSISAEPPPEISTTTKSRSVTALNSASTARPAVRLPGVGSGWPPSIKVTCFGKGWPAGSGKCGTAATPAASRGPATSAAARVMPTPALPRATRYTCSTPARSLGSSQRRTAWAGSAAASAAARSAARWMR